jgi:hypothetical protein
MVQIEMKIALCNRQIMSNNIAWRTIKTTSKMLIWLNYIIKNPQLCFAN